MQLLLFLVLTVVCATIIERFHSPKGPWLAASLPSYLMRLTAFIGLFFIDFALTWRGIHAFFFTQAVVLLANRVSVGKTYVLREPLVFSDCILYFDVFRYPELFHLTAAKTRLIMLGFVSVALAALFALTLETPIIGHDNFLLRLLTLVAIVSVLIAPFNPLTKPLMKLWASRFITKPDIQEDCRKHGLLTVFVGYLIHWASAENTTLITAKQARRKASTTSVYDQIIIIQSEAFCDLSRLGGDGISLPNFDRLKNEALQYGLFENAFAGGYTQRTEFAVLTGLTVEDIGFNRYYPYFRAADFLSLSLPNNLNDSGYHTTFIHPFTERFFDRYKAMPALGFKTLLTKENLPDLPTYGPHVSDRALGEYLVSASKEALATDGRKDFFFITTMENHAPWYQGRLPDFPELGAVETYCKHLENADAMLGQVVDYLDAQEGRFLLLFYGDHIPLLDEFAKPFPSEETDYIMLELGTKKATSKSVQKDIAAWDVLELIQRLNQQQ
ncbi:MAG: LTA synthase family protein [Hyphomicrobiales bacterium]